MRAEAQSVDVGWIERHLAAAGAPLIDGHTATFVWKGERAPRLKADFLRSESQERTAEFTKVAADLWTYSAHLPADAYIEYHFEGDGERTLDPFNRRKIYDGVVGYKSYFGMPEWQPTPLLRRGRGVPRGRLTKHSMSGLFRTATVNRTVYLYQPPVTEPCPLLVVLDGNDYLRRGHVTAIVDNLIATERMRPVAMALPAHGKSARFVEYDASEATLGFLEFDLLPMVRERLNVLDEPGAYAIMGASMAGLMAIYAALRLPHIFGKALSQSGALGASWWGQTALLPLLVESLPRPPVSLWIDVGRYDFLLEANREMRDLLTRKGYDFTYREYNGGHNYTCWRNELGRGLETMFPPS